MSCGQGWRRAAITVVAAYGLVLQAWLSSFGAALHAPVVGAEPLCNPALGASPAPDRHGPEAPSNPCCVLACHSPGLGPAPPGAPAAVPRAFAPSRDGRLRDAFLEIAPINPRPVGSRAPPLAG